jgi:DmsE family decaheme c-type cytochrome
MKHKILLFTSMAGCLIWLLVGLSDIVSAAAPPATGPDDATCLECHDGYDKTLAATPHKLASETEKPAVKVACVSCHSGGDVHINDPSAANIGNPAKLTAKKALKVCSQCHVEHRELDNYGFDAHTNLELNCADCHNVHGGKRSLLLSDNAEFCWRCHEEIKSAFRQRSNHPVRQGNLTCLSCHRFTKRVDQNYAYDFARTCQDCHPQEGGPFPHEHAAVDAYLVNGSGCVECHDPHGSPNDMLLKQPVKQLCMECHIVPGHTTAHNGAYAGYDCLTCHTQVHGSYTNSSLLDPNLEAVFGSACYCHNH